MVPDESSSEDDSSSDGSYYSSGSDGGGSSDGGSSSDGNGSSNGSSGSDVGVSGKSTTPSAVFDLVLSRQNAVVALNCGTLRKRLRMSINANFAVAADQRDKLPGVVGEVMSEMVRIGSETTRMAQQAIMLHILRVMMAHPTTGAADVAARRQAFQEYTRHTGSAFFRSILFDIFKCHDRSLRRGAPRRATDANQIVRDVVVSYCDMVKQ